MYYIHMYIVTYTYNIYVNVLDVGSRNCWQNVSHQVSQVAPPTCSLDRAVYQAGALGDPFFSWQFWWETHDEYALAIIAIEHGIDWDRI